MLLFNLCNLGRSDNTAHPYSIHIRMAAFVGLLTPSVHAKRGLCNSVGFEPTAFCSLGRVLFLLNLYITVPGITGIYICTYVVPSSNSCFCESLKLSFLS